MSKEELLINGEPVFLPHERLETKVGLARITEENMLTLAKHFGWRVGYDDQGRLGLYQKGETYPHVRVGDWINDRGNQTYSSDWRPKGTYREVEGFSL